MKVIKTLLASLLLLSLLFALSACSGNPTPEDDTHTHTPSKWIVDKDATYTETGSKHQVCSECGEVIATESIPVYSAGLKYEVNEDGTTCDIVGMGTCTDKDIHIPPEIDGYIVTGIRAKAAFSGMGSNEYIPPFNRSETTSVIIPNSVTNISKAAFFCCASLTRITIPDSVTNIGEWAFAGCESVSSIIVEKGNPVYHSEGNCLIETATKTLIVGCYNSVIPDDGSVTSIGFRAFAGCKNLKTLTIPDSITSIGYEAFSGYCGLTSITIPNSVTSIGEWAFAFCESLTSITYNGTKAEWKAITKGRGWDTFISDYVIYCTDGDIIG